MRLLAALLLIVGALAAVGFARHEERIREQDTLAAVASDLAGRQVGVHCPGFLRSLVRVRTEGGYVKFHDDGRPYDYTDLSPETCKALRHLDRFDFSCLQHGDCAYKQFRAAWAAKTLPALEHHQQMAKTTAQKLGSTATR